MKGYKQFLDKLLHNKQFMMLFSLVVAFLLWFIVVATISPNSTITIYGVPITVDENTSNLSAAGLHVIEESASSINVVVTGPRAVIGGLSADDFIARPDVSSVTGTGEYKLTLNVALGKPKEGVTITSLSASNVTIDFDTIITRSYPVTANIDSSGVAEGYRLGTTAVSPQAVTVKGPSSEVNQIAAACVTARLSDNAKVPETLAGSIVLYDSGNNKLALKHTSLDTATASVNVTVLKEKTVPLTVGFVNVPSGFDTVNINYSITPSEIMVAGSESDINSLTSISLDNIDFTQLDLTSTLTQKIQLPQGIVSVDGLSAATVSVNLLNTEKKTLSTSTINIENLPYGYAARVRTRLISNITLFGPSGGIGSVASVTATVDFSQIAVATGTYQVPVTISVPGGTGYWTTSKYTVTVNVWRD